VGTFKGRAMDQAVSRLQPRRPGFDLSSVYMRFVVDRVTMKQIPPAPYPYIDFPLAVSFHLCSIQICT